MKYFVMPISGGIVAEAEKPENEDIREGLRKAAEPRNMIALDPWQALVDFTGMAEPLGEYVVSPSNGTILRITIEPT